LGEAFFFFTPDGERLWVPGWSPEYLHPRGGPQRAGAVFRTNADGEETLWMVTTFDPATGVAEYVRVTPGSRVGTVSIRSEASASTETIVHVTYRVTALTPNGNDVIAAFDAGFGDMMREWAAGVSSALRR
jgi:hypothetical protein